MSDNGKSEILYVARIITIENKPIRIGVLTRELEFEEVKFHRLNKTCPYYNKCLSIFNEKNKEEGCSMTCRFCPTFKKFRKCYNPTLLSEYYVLCPEESIFYEHPLGVKFGLS